MFFGTMSLNNLSAGLMEAEPVPTTVEADQSVLDAPNYANVERLGTEMDQIAGVMMQAETAADGLNKTAAALEPLASGAVPMENSPGMEHCMRALLLASESLFNSCGSRAPETRFLSMEAGALVPAKPAGGELATIPATKQDTASLGKKMVEAAKAGMAKTVAALRELVARFKAFVKEVFDADVRQIKQANGMLEMAKKDQSHGGGAEIAVSSKWTYLSKSVGSSSDGVVEMARALGTEWNKVFTTYENLLSAKDLVAAIKSVQNIAGMGSVENQESQMKQLALKCLDFKVDGLAELDAAKTTALASVDGTKFSAYLGEPFLGQGVLVVKPKSGVEFDAIANELPSNLGISWIPHPSLASVKVDDAGESKIKSAPTSALIPMIQLVLQHAQARQNVKSDMEEIGRSVDALAERMIAAGTKSADGLVAKAIENVRLRRISNVVSRSATNPVNRLLRLDQSIGAMILGVVAANLKAGKSAGASSDVLDNGLLGNSGAKPAPAAA